MKKAKDEVYNSLPECCHYREIQQEQKLSQVSTGEVENSISGIVLSEDNKGNFTPLAGASVIWAGTQNGTQTDRHGFF